MTDGALAARCCPRRCKNPRLSDHRLRKLPGRRSPNRPAPFAPKQSLRFRAIERLVLYVARKLSAGLTFAQIPKHGVDFALRSKPGLHLHEQVVS